MDIIQVVSSFLKTRFSLDNFKAHESETIDSVKRNVEFKGTNLWILIFAIMLASVGLNVNSTAVIIGAMLISPLMGPIMGLGLGAAINDFNLVKKAGQNLLIATVISIVTSAFYFYITPLDEAQSELLARVSPSIWDVLIAFFGGMAGIIASSSREKGNVIPGVAIATALMPPLCTAGYGIATGQMLYFLGAFYLYVINTVFIFISTFIVIRFLKYQKVNFVDINREKKVKRYILFLVLITVLPSTFVAFNIVKKTIFNRNANLFITNEFALPNSQVISKNYFYDTKFPKIEVLIIGESIGKETQAFITSKMPNYGLSNTELVIKQGTGGLGQNEIASLRSDLMEGLYEKNTKVIAEKEALISALRDSIKQFEREDLHVNEVFMELKTLFPKVKKFSMNTGNYFDEEGPKDSTCIVFIHFSPKATNKETDVIKQWLKIRTGFPYVLLYEL